MAPHHYRRAAQEGPGENAAIAFFNPHALQLAAENILLFLNGFAIQLYCYYSLIAYLSIKPRGLARDAILRSVYWTSVVSNSFLLLSLYPWGGTIKPHAITIWVLVQIAGACSSIALLWRRGSGDKALLVARRFLNAIGITAFLCLSALREMLGASHLVAVPSAVIAFSICLTLFSDIVHVTWRCWKTYVVTPRAHAKREPYVGELQWYLMQVSSGA